jgi:hypothetical protein
MQLRLFTLTRIRAPHRQRRLVDTFLFETGGHDFAYVFVAVQSVFASFELCFTVLEKKQHSCPHVPLQQGCKHHSKFNPLK